MQPQQRQLDIIVQLSPVHTGDYSRQCGQDFISRRFGSAAILYVISSTIGFLSDSYTLLVLTLRAAKFLTTLSQKDHFVSAYLTDFFGIFGKHTLPEMYKKRIYN